MIHAPQTTNVSNVG